MRRVKLSHPTLTLSEQKTPSHPRARLANELRLPAIVYPPLNHHKFLKWSLLILAPILALRMCVLRRIIIKLNFL